MSRSFKILAFLFPFKGSSIAFFSWFIITLIVVVGCGQNIQSNHSASPQLTVSAAASIQDALAEIKPLYQQKNIDTDITYNFGSSGSLQQQIEQGAPVDIFISAAAKQMDALEAKNLLLSGTRRNLLKNEMVLIVPKDNTTIQSFADLATDKFTKIALGEPESVPAGKYAEEILTSLKIFDAVKTKVIYGKDVRQVLNYVATENVDAGIVYRSDAKISDRVKVVATASEDTHSPVVYPIAILKGSIHPESAQQFQDFLFTPDVKRIFEKYGFITVNS